MCYLRYKLVRNNLRDKRIDRLSHNRHARRYNRLKVDTIILLVLKLYCFTYEHYTLRLPIRQGMHTCYRIDKHHRSGMAGHT